MNEALNRKCEKFIDSRELLKNCFKWSSITDQCCRATFLLGEDTYVSENKLIEMKEYIKKNEGIFSELRSHIELSLCVKMALSADYEEYYEILKAIMREIKTSWLFSSSYKAVSAMIIMENKEPKDYRRYVDKTRMIYEQMKRDHSWLTADYDMIFAAMLAVSDINVSDILLEMDEAFRILKENFRSSQNQELSHILALNMESPGEKTNRFLEIYDLLKANGIKVSKYYHLEILAVLSLLEMDDADIIDQINQAELFLSSYPKFRGWNMFSDERILYAIMLVIKTNSHDSNLIDNVLLYVILRMQRSRDAAAAAAAA